MTEQPDPSDETLLFSRPTPARVKLCEAVFFVVAVTALPAASVVGVQVWFQISFGSQPHWLQPVLDAVPFGTAALVGSLVGVALLPIALSVLTPVWARRRYGSVEVHQDQLVFRFALAPPWVKQTVLAEHVTSRTPTPHGLMLESSERWSFARFMFPLLVPVTSEDELAQVLARLDASAPAPDSEATVFGRQPPGFLVAALVVFVLGLAAPPVVLVATRFGQSWAMGGLLLVTVPLIMIMAWFDAWFIQPRYRKLHLGSEALLLANRRIPYDDLTRAATEDATLTLEVGRRRLLVRLRDETPAALALLRERLAGRKIPLEVASRLPGWAQPGPRRRRLVVGIAFTAGLWSFYMAAALSNPDIYDDVYVLDDDDQYVHVIYRITDLKPRLVSVLEDPADANSSYFLDDQLVVRGLYRQEFESSGEKRFQLDLERGFSWHDVGGDAVVDPATTWHAVDSAGRSRAAVVDLPSALTVAVLEAYDAALHQPSIPALLDPALAEIDDPTLRAFLRGETSRRTYDLRDGEGGRLLWGVSHGEPVFAVIAPADLPLDLLVGVFRHEDEDLPGVPASVGEVGLTWFAPMSSDPLDLGGPPSLEDLRRISEAIEAGTSVRQACESLVAPRLRALDEETRQD